MQDSIFTQIIKGEIPSHKIYEDEYTLAFLDIHPIQAGHVLVVPKVQVDFVWDLTEVDFQHLMSTVQKVGKRIREVFTDKSRVAVIVEGLDIANHAHVKLFPFNNHSEFSNIPDSTKEPDHQALAAIAEKLAFQ